MKKTSMVFAGAVLSSVASLALADGTEVNPNYGVVAMLGNTTRCAVSNTTPDSVTLKTLKFTYKCDGVKTSVSKDVNMTLFTEEIVNIDVNAGVDCRLVEPVRCEVTFQ